MFFFGSLYYHGAACIGGHRADPFTRRHCGRQEDYHRYVYNLRNLIANFIGFHRNTLCKEDLDPLECNNHMNWLNWPVMWS
jgi:hypothetical protein